MSIFTLEVAGWAVACICTETRAAAEETIRDPWFRDELLGLGREPVALWNGVDGLQLRSPTPEEEATVRERIEASRFTDEPLDEDNAIVFLVEKGEARTPADHKLILASRVEHTSVYNDAGERIGHIEDLSIDRQDGQVVYAIMSFGGFLGIGKKFHPLPWSLLDYDPGRGGYVVPLDKAALENAPYYEPEELKNLGGPSHEAFGRRILEYYGQYGPPQI